MELADLYGSIGHLLRRASQIANAVFLAEVRESELTTVQYATLNTIDQIPGIDVTRLSGLVALDRSTLGAVVDRLEAKGLVLRAPGKQDRRLKMLYLTPSGAAVTRQTDVAAIRVHEQVLAYLTPADRKELLRI
ncbi:MAG: MarR family winged helix-turn-helix transcriptional regulator, partial [Janthinobacterium lividum]